MNEWTISQLAQQAPPSESIAPIWSAVAGSVTAATAVVAAIFAFMQVRHARKIRQEQAQPYVAIFIESSVVSPHFVDLVIKNYGNTAARNVRIDITPTPVKSGSGGDQPEPVDYPTTLPTLVPSQEWRTLWDFAPDRKQQDLPDHHKAIVTCDGVLGAGTLTFDFDLNWDSFTGRRWVQTYGMHDAAKALREMERQIRGWREGPNRGLKVYIRDGDKRDEQMRQQRGEALAEHERLSAELRRNESDDDA